MNSNLSLRRMVLGLCIAFGLGVGGLAHAGDTLSEETRVDVRTAAGPVETIIVNDMQTGESRSITTASGHPALVTRTATGMKLELAGESFDVALPEPGSDAEAALGPDAKIVKIEKRVDRNANAAGGDQKEIVVIKRHGDPANTGQMEVEAFAANARGPLADGQRVRVILQIRRETTETAPAN